VSLCKDICDQTPYNRTKKEQSVRIGLLVTVLHEETPRRKGRGETQLPDNYFQKEVHKSKYLKPFTDMI